MSTGIDPKQLRDLVVRPVLKHLDLPGGEVAERLVMGTAAHESMGFRYLRQRDSGPALGLWQMEPATYRDIWGRLPDWLQTAVWRWKLPYPDEDAHEQLAGNLYFAAAMCRAHYYMRPFRMPETASVEELAALWKEHWNSRLGAGRPEQFVRAYGRLVAPLYSGKKSDRLGR